MLHRCCSRKVAQLHTQKTPQNTLRVFLGVELRSSRICYTNPRSREGVTFININLWKKSSTRPSAPLPFYTAGLYIKENAFLSCLALSISETVMTLTKDAAPYTSTSARISGSHGYGEIKTLFCNFLKPTALRWSLIISRRIFFFSGMSNITTLHFPSHFSCAQCARRVLRCHIVSRPVSHSL